MLAQVRAHLDELVVATAKFGAYESLTARQVEHGGRKTGSKPAINLTKFRGPQITCREDARLGANPELCAAGNSPIRHVALLLSHQPTTNHQTSRHSSTRRYAEEQRLLATHKSGTCAVSTLPRQTLPYHGQPLRDDHHVVRKCTYQRCPRRWASHHGWIRLWCSS